MNVTKKREVKWIVGLAVALLIGLIGSIELRGMKRLREEDNQQEQEKEFFQEFKDMPQDVQDYTRRLQLMKNAVVFLGLQPVTLGHMAQVLSVAISGDKVVTGSDDGKAKIWNLKTGQLLHTLAGHTDWVRSVAVAGDTVVTGSNDGTAKIWNLNTGQLLRTLAGHMAQVMSVAVAGDKVVTGSMDRTAKIWDLKTAKLLRTLEGHRGWVFSVAVAGDTVVTGSDDETAKIWDLNTGTLAHTLAGHTGSVLSVAVAGDKVVTGSEDGTAKIWSLSPNLQGTPESNPLVWIVKRATIPQLEFIKRAYEATILGQDVIIALPEKLNVVQANESQAQQDGRIYFSFPDAVRVFLRTKLNIRK